VHTLGNILWFFIAGLWLAIGWRLGGHHRVERRPVPVGRPHLEPVLWTLPERLRVHDQRLHAHCRLVGAHGDQLGMQGVQQDLQRREPLLPVDHRPLLHRAKRVLQLLDYDGTQEVWLVPGVPVIE
jgi:hypothetical protein